MLRAGDRSRTGDLNLGKVALYQLSYARSSYTTLEPPVGLEPTTPSLRMTCSTIELRWHRAGIGHGNLFRA